jgi:transcriptional regulator with XRE-family HTH domain
VKSLQQRFGKVLRRRREASRLSQEALASQADLHRNYVGLLERGQRMPSLLVIQRLAKALGTSMADVVGEIERSVK